MRVPAVSVLITHIGKLSFFKGSTRCGMNASMEFTKRSNLGSLLAAVMVGLLSLCINQVFRVEPDDVDQFLARLGQMRKDVQERIRPIDRSPLILLGELRRVEKTLNNIFHKQVRGRKCDTDQVNRVVAILTTTANALKNHEYATSQQVEQGHMLAFSGLFLAAQMMPDGFSEQFRQMGDGILNMDSTELQKEHVRLLSEFHEFNVGQIQDAVILQKLQAYSQRQTDESLAIRLYVLISEEVWNQGRLNLARDILLQGVNTYHDHPDKQKLANRLIDLEIESLPSHLF